MSTAQWDYISQEEHQHSQQRETVLDSSTQRASHGSAPESDAHKREKVANDGGNRPANRQSLLRVPAASGRLMQLFRRFSNEEDNTNAPSTSAQSVASPTSSVDNGNSDIVPYYGRRAAFNKDKWGSKMRHAWNNVRYGWSFSSMSKFETDSPIWLLGRFYHARPPKPSQSWSPAGGGMFVDNASEDPMDDEDFKEFYGDFTSRLWMTYRSNFPRIGQSSVTTDCGWGCMLRSMQMLTAQALLMHILGRDWTMHAPARLEVRRAHQRIVRLFADEEAAPLSVHRLVTTKLRQDKDLQLSARYSERYSSESHLANALNLSSSSTDMNGDLMASTAESSANKQVRKCDCLNAASLTGDFPELSNVRLYVANDCCVCLAEITRLAMEPSADSSSPPDYANSSSNSTRDVDYAAPPNYFQIQTTKSDDEWTNSIFIVIPLRLGGEFINPLYASHLKTLFSLDKCCGVAGGKPKHSMYFCGWHDNSLIFLDPHLSQEAEKRTLTCDVDEINTETYHCRFPRTLPFDQMDPSCSVGFYVRSKKELSTLLDDLSDIITWSATSQDSPTTDAYSATRTQRRHALFSVVENSDELFRRFSSHTSSSSSDRRFVGRRRTSASFNGTSPEHSPTQYHDDFEIL